MRLSYPLALLLVGCGLSAPAAIRAQETAGTLLPDDLRQSEELFTATAEGKNQVNPRSLACVFYRRGRGNDFYYAASLNAVAARKGDQVAAAYAIKFLRCGVGVPKNEVEAYDRLRDLLTQRWTKLPEINPSVARKIRDELVLQFSMHRADQPTT